MGAGAATPQPPPPPRLLQPWPPSTPLPLEAVQAFSTRHMSLFETHHVSIVFANGGRPPLPRLMKVQRNQKFSMGGGGGGLYPPPNAARPAFCLSRAKSRASLLHHMTLFATHHHASMLFAN